MSMSSGHFATDAALYLLQVDAHALPSRADANISGLSLPFDIPSNLADPGRIQSVVASVPSTVMIAGIDLGMQHNEMVQELGVPVLALTAGLCLYTMKTQQLVSKLLIFFGAQTFMNLYMKIVLSRCVVSPEHGMVGIPAPFIVTAFQQVVSFLLLMSMVATSLYSPKPIQSQAEYVSILCLSVAFTLNIALNNFSMALLDLSVNLMIRSSAPLTTYLCQVVVGKVMGKEVKAKHFKSMILLLIGVSCGALVVFAKGHSLFNNQHGERAHMYLGVVSCVCSLLAAASELNVVAIMGTGTRLNALDACCYMAVPSALQLVLPILLWAHPVSWPKHDNMTDFAVIREVYALHPRAVGLVLLSGVFALAYNAILYGIIQALSPSHAAVASNFNKMAVIAIAYLLGMERLPPSPWSSLVLLGVVGNAAGFAGFGYAESVQREQEAAAAKAAEKQVPVVGK